MLECRRALAVVLSASALTLGTLSLRAEGAKPPAAAKPASCTPAEKDRPRHDQFLKDKEAQLKQGPIRVVFEGDSITDGWRGGGRRAWDEAFGKYNPLNLGIGGDRTQHLLWRIDHGELDGLDPKAVVLMIGTNNMGDPAEDITAGVTCVVEAIHAKLPNATVLLLGIFPRGERADDPVRAKIKGINAELAKLDGKDNVKYLDIGDKFLGAGGTLPKDVMPDALHPNEKGYAIWAEAIGPTLDELAK